MAQSARVALATTYALRGKEHLVLIRPYSKGLMMHTMYYADEIRSVEDVGALCRPSAPGRSEALLEPRVGVNTGEAVVGTILTGEAHTE